MTEKEIEILSDLIVNKIVNKQKELDDDFIGKWVAAGGGVDSPNGVDINISEPEDTETGLNISLNYLVKELSIAVKAEDYVKAGQLSAKVDQVKWELKKLRDE